MSDEEQEEVVSTLIEESAEAFANLESVESDVDDTQEAVEDAKEEALDALNDAASDVDASDDPGLAKELEEASEGLATTKEVDSENLIIETVTIPSLPKDEEVEKSLVDDEKL